MTMTHKATCTLSIDVSSGDRESPRRLNAAFSRVADLLGSLGLPATFCVPLNDAPAAIDHLAGARVPHELALCLDRAWACESVPRHIFARHLAAHVDQAAKLGWRPSTLVVWRRLAADHLDLVIRRGITALRTGSESPCAGALSSWLGRGASTANDQPRNLRWGLWAYSPSLSTPTHGRGALKRAVARAAATRGLIHIRVDLDQTTASARGLQTLERMLEIIVAHTHGGGMTAATLHGLTERMALRCTRAPARSILAAA